jgi:hypothetical protein
MDEGEEGLVGTEPEIDLEFHPFASSSSAGPDLEWERMIRSIKPRKADFRLRINKELEFDSSLKFSTLNPLNRTTCRGSARVVDKHTITHS